MRKMLIVFAVAITIFMPISALATVTEASNESINLEVKNILNEDFTHAVLAEYGTMSTCPYCPPASSQLYSIYNSNDYSFYYVSLVTDKNWINIKDRCTELGISSVPVVHFDGGYRSVPGAQQDEIPYRNAIEQCGARTVADIDLDLEAQWKGGGTIKIVVNVQNNEPEEFNGHIRVYITEITSRWNDQQGNPYHYAVLGIPIDKSLAVSQQSQPIPLEGETYTFTKLWIGSLYGFGDIEQDNILVIASVFESDTDYVVQTASITPSVSRSVSYPAFMSLLERFPNAFPIIRMLFKL